MGGGGRPLLSNIDKTKTTMMKFCWENEDGQCYNGLKAEMNILYDLSHRNVVQLVGYSFVKNFEEEGND